MKPSEDQLISHIKKTLASHEEPYLPGAWEKFNESTAEKKKRVFGFYQFLNVAAMILVCAFIFLYVDKVVQKPTQDVAKTKKAQKISPKNTAPSKSTEQPIENASPADALASREAGPSNQPSDATEVAAASSPMNVAKTASQNYLAKNTNDANAVARTLNSDVADAAVNQQDIVMQVKPRTQTVDRVEHLPPASASRESKPAEKVTGFESFLKQEQLAKSKNETAEKSVSNRDKWELGLMVAPSISNNNKLNLGYGLSMGYALSKRVSVVSGVSYNDMTASNQVSAPVNTASIVSGDAKNLESVEADISGIDIPLGIKYNLSKKVYANVGVSAFAVLNQRQNNTYLQETTMQSTSTDPNSFGEIRMLVMNQRVTEKAPEPSVDSKLIGFYNLSFGIKQPLSKKNTLSLEPFVKLPMKESGPDNLKLIGTGIKLKLDF
jgi:hypothetical protein